MNQKVSGQALTTLTVIVMKCQLRTEMPVILVFVRPKLITACTKMNFKIYLSLFRAKPISARFPCTSIVFRIGL